MERTSRPVIRRQHAMLGLPNLKLTEAEWIRTLERLEPDVRYSVPRLTLNEFLERARPEGKKMGRGTTKSPARGT
jgi:hypothetical protein